MEKINILGVQVSAIDMPMAIDVIDGWISDRRPNYVYIREVHGIMASQEVRRETAPWSTDYLEGILRRTL